MSKPPRLPSELRRKIVKAVRPPSGSMQKWRLESIYGADPLPTGEKLPHFDLCPPKKSVAHKNRWAAEWRLYNYRDRFIVHVPNWFGDPEAERIKKETN